MQRWIIKNERTFVPAPCVELWVTEGYRYSSMSRSTDGARRLYEHRLLPTESKFF